MVLGPHSDHEIPSGICSNVPRGRPHFQACHKSYKEPCSERSTSTSLKLFRRSAALLIRGCEALWRFSGMQSSLQR